MAIPERLAKDRRKRTFGAGAAASAVKAADLIIDCRYANDLPPPPVPKLLKALPAAERLYRYTTTSLELDHRPFLLAEEDCEAFVEKARLDAYGEPPEPGSMLPPPPPQDQRLLNDDDVGEDVKIAEHKRKRLTETTEAFHREAFGLQLPQLITNDVFTERQRYVVGTEAAEKTLIREPPMIQTPEELAQKIESTFAAAREAPVHPADSSIRPRRVLPVVPDALLWANRYKQVVFDELPSTHGRDDLLLKTVPHPRATCFGYFTAEGGEGGEMSSYRLSQNYIWDNRGLFSRCAALNEGEALLLSFPGEGDDHGEARFVAVPPWMRLKKQKAHRLDISLETQSLSVKHREPSQKEAEEEQERMRTVLSDEALPMETSIDWDGTQWVTTNPRTQALGRAGSRDLLPIAAGSGPSKDGSGSELEAK